MRDERSDSDGENLGGEEGGSLPETRGLRSLMCRVGSLHWSMGHSMISHVILLGLFLLTLPGIAVAATEDAYQLNPGDVLNISVWKEEGMQREVMVLPDGKISFPLAGHVIAAGKTVQELEIILATRLKKFYPNTVISVAVKSVVGNKIFVIGEVNNPGAYQVAHRVDVVQVLSLAGGLGEFADKRGIKVLRRVEGKQDAIPFDYSNVQKGQNLPTNILLRSGDVVVVPKRELF